MLRETPGGAGRKSWTPELDEVVRRAYPTMSAERIGRAVGMHRSTVARHARAMGLAKRRGGNRYGRFRRYSDVEERSIASMYLKGCTGKHMASVTGRSVRAIWSKVGEMRRQGRLYGDDRG